VLRVEAGDDVVELAAGVVGAADGVGPAAAGLAEQAAREQRGRPLAKGPLAGDLVLCDLPAVPAVGPQGGLGQDQDAGPEERGVRVQLVQAAADTRGGQEDGAERGCVLVTAVSSHGFFLSQKRAARTRPMKARKHTVG
jgi:hypothetical protein